MNARPCLSGAMLAILTLCASAQAQGRTAAEFRKYASEKLSGVSRAKLDAIVRRVDTNEDGVISDEEYAGRTSIIRSVMTGPEPWLEDAKEARKASRETGLPLLVFFYADWATPAKIVEEKLLPHEKLQEAFASFVLAKVDIDKQREAPQEFKVQALPTFVAIGTDGTEIGRKIGVSAHDDLLTWLTGIQAEVARAAPLRLRVLSYNIHHGEGVDRRLDLPRIAGLIKSVKPDIVALQEVDRKVQRSSSVDQPAELARLTGMKVVFGKNIDFGGGEYGNAVLSRFEISAWKNHKLPNVNNGEQRGVLDVRLKTRAGAVRLLATHFDHRRADTERRQSAEAVNKLFGADPRTPTLLAGDLNDTPRSATLQALSEHWLRANQTVQPTVPVGSPTRQIDYILLAPKARWKVIETKVLDEAIASDHRAVLAVLELRPVVRKEPQVREGASENPRSPQ